MTPGEAELARRELGRADEALRAAGLLLGQRAAEGAANGLYYAVFHGARAALAVRGLHAKTPSGQITLFVHAFGPAPVLASLLDLRARADYGEAEFTASLKDLRARAADAEAFVERCRAIVDEAVARGPDEPDPPADY